MRFCGQELQLEVCQVKYVRRWILDLEIFNILTKHKGKLKTHYPIDVELFGILAWLLKMKIEV